MNKTLPIVAAIVAMTENRVIGKDNQLPWHLPADLKHFKAITTGHPIIMGRKTFASIGRALPNRANIIVTRTAGFTAADCLVASSIEDAIMMAKKMDNNEIFIIGGAEIYRQALPFVQRIYLTKVHINIEGDAFFPELDMQTWREVSVENFAANAENSHQYSFYTLDKVAKHN